MWNARLPLLHMFAHQEPSFHQTVLSARFVPVGTLVPVKDGPATANVDVPSAGEPAEAAAKTHDPRTTAAQTTQRERITIQEPSARDPGALDPGLVRLDFRSQATRTTPRSRQRSVSFAR